MSSIRDVVTTRKALAALIVTLVLLVGIPLVGTESHSVSITRVVLVDSNSPPSITVPDYPLVCIRLPSLFIVTASDPDPLDDLLFTWFWGDESVNVTSQPEALHAYSQRGDYVLTVWVDDHTGLSDHNVSDTGRVNVEGPSEPPVIVEFNVDDDTPLTEQLVTFRGTATDVNGDLCVFTFDFGDGNATTLEQSTAGQTLKAAHTYRTAGTYTATLTVSDNQAAPQTSSPLPVIVGLASSFTLNLVAGWNMVTVPLVGYGYKASMLGLNPGDTIAEWNSLTRTYKDYIVGVPVNDFAIAPSTGYWINVPTGTRTLTLYGEVPNTTQSRSITVGPGGGWEIVGFVGFNMTRHASDVPAMYSVPNGIQLVARWDPIRILYTSWIPVIPGMNDFRLVPGEAYWALCTASGTLSYTP